MLNDEYSAKQIGHEKQYEETYSAWIQSMPPEERLKMKELGLDKPMLSKHGNGSPEQDFADSPRCSHTPDIAELIDSPDSEPEHPSEQDGMKTAIRIVRHLVADLLCESNARLSIECVAIATGLSAYQGETMTDVARRHGITRAAVSKRCVDIVERLGLPPSRAMRSEQARKTYRKSRNKNLNK